MPLLIALGASVVLMAWRGKGSKAQAVHRELRLEDLYTGYRQNVMAPDEVLAWIKVPKAVAKERVRVYKISKRFEDDISAVCLALNLHIEGGVVTHASIGVGGVAATPVRAVKTQAALMGQPWNATTVRAAQAVLRAEFNPISDMRASSAYRVEVLGNLLQRYWLESQGLTDINLESFVLEGASA
jgi:xanthine dehydrogenase small subunit